MEQSSDENNTDINLDNIYQQNKDMIGWLNVPGTAINYPVVRTTDRPDYYLRRNFNGKYSIGGCPYMQENCDAAKPSDNLIIYGHNMKNGTTFGNPEKFKSKAFWEKHKTLTFTTLTESKTYEIVSVFKTFVYSKGPDSFKYYQFVDLENYEDFDNFVHRIKELALYDTNVDVQYGDKLITLSTCEYSQKNGRLVPAAKQISG